MSKSDEDAEKGYRETLKGDGKLLNFDWGAKNGDDEAIKGDGEGKVQWEIVNSLQSGRVDIGRLCSLGILLILKHILILLISTYSDDICLSHSSQEHTHNI